MNITINEFLEKFEIKDSYSLFELVKNDEQKLRALCTAVQQTADNIEHIKQFLK